MNMMMNMNVQMKSIMMMMQSPDEIVDSAGREITLRLRVFTLQHNNNDNEAQAGAEQRTDGATKS